MDLEIINFERQQSVIVQLRNHSEFKFYLGGSRFFHYHDPVNIPISKYTDWDFNVQFSSEVVIYLNSLGFHSRDNPYMDVLAEDVFYLDECNIQVVLRKDIELYKKAISRIDLEFYRRYLWKSSPEFQLKDSQAIQNIMNALFFQHSSRNELEIL